MEPDRVCFLRYPGGKTRMLGFLTDRLAKVISSSERLVEPFVGGGAFFFAARPQRALLSDVNRELIDLYRGIRRYPERVWRTYRAFPSTKRGYYEIRTWQHTELDLASCAARTLYLNRTCFKGMWRHNLDGEFNVGYGGQSRRWVISRRMLLEVARYLRRALLRCADFEDVVDACDEGDFVFVDPPYKPGKREMLHDHYGCGKFSFEDHRRLSAALDRASRRGVPWAMTTSTHHSILRLYRGYQIEAVPRGTGRQIGSSTLRSGEVLICNLKEKRQ